ncbi:MULTISPECIES: 2-carboxy-1,4-naphthoquinone phytyltransferase [unclassified Synechocystis]|uniref:2-carboxy-1,4-naphthoquinone phytyltransferase n=1 Tax=unclassified Synechocystis TaxID=2640012 RepID=UPI0004075C7E|nr:MULTISPECIES: 2-carboxy-1,4-naphthoquinone phytyltransferase [unclassified Synechocystis]AIE73921.1 1,4-dihydroxy-2-naphthoate octaprenyltransferase [Synechocystis sp. PCC 6714]MCT0252490.1 2-carboxy-1,4-naphthoquinone phytyltransferase [Synechocystis sp. CS-94]
MSESPLVVESNPPSERKLWLAAIKPPMYTVAVVPITVGSAVAYGATGQWQGGVFTIFLLSAIAIIAWINLSNDVFDSDTGIDVRKAHSVVNLTGNRNLVFWLSNFFLLAGLVGLISISWLAQDWTVLGLIAVAIFLGYTYQGPPFRLGYLGLGELICLITFGPLAIAAAYYSQAQAFSWDMAVPSFFVGLSTAIILFCSHFHQVEDDLAAGKKSPIVRLGTKLGSQVLTLSVISLYLITAIGVLFNLAPWQILLVTVSLPWAVQLVHHVGQYHDQPEKVSNCKFIAVNLHFISGMLMAAGYSWTGLA